MADGYNSVIRQLSPVGTDWVTTTVLGTPGAGGYTDGTGAAARFASLSGICFDSFSTNCYVIEGNSVKKLQKSTAGWTASTWAGYPPSTPGGVDAGGLSARFFDPQGLASDSQGNVYVADTGNHNIRKITPEGSSCRVSTIAGATAMTSPTPGYLDGTSTGARFLNPRAIAVFNDTNLFVADAGNRVIRKITLKAGSWVTTTLAGNPGVAGSADGTNGGARFQSPSALAADAAGNLFVLDDEAHVLRKITMQGTNAIVTTLAGVAGETGSADGANSEVRFNLPQGLVSGPTGELFVADTNDGTVRRVRFEGTNCVVQTIAGRPEVRRRDGPGELARFSRPSRMVADGHGGFFVADLGNHAIRRLVRTNGGWTVSTIAGKPGVIGGMDGTNDAARFNFPKALAVDAWGSVYVADLCRVCRVSPDGTNWIVTTLAGADGKRGNADGTNGAARFFAVGGIAVDLATNVLVGDSFLVRKISPAGTNWVVTTITGGWGGADGTNGAARFGGASGMAADAAGNVYVADAPNHTIRRISPAGTNWVVSTIAGLSLNSGSADGTNANARFNYPESVAIDAAGNLFVGDSQNATVRKLTQAGTNWVVTTVGGLAKETGSTDGVGTQARFNRCEGVAVDDAGNVLVADTNNDTIRFGVHVPALRAILTPDGLVCGWPVWASNFVLEGRVDLEPNGSWEVLSSGTVAGEDLIYTNAPDSSKRYLRLRLVPQ